MRLAWIAVGLAGIAFPWAAACSAATDDANGAAGSGSTQAGTGGAAATGAGGGGGDPIIQGSSSSISAGGAGTGGESCVAGVGGGGSQTEVCDNGKDDDLNGFIDEGCTCTPGLTQACFPGAADLCDCKVGQQECITFGEFGQWGPCEGAVAACNGALDDICEVCGNGVDDDCDMETDEQCVIDLMVDIDGDCVIASCPPQAPHPIACDIDMSGDDERGCIAHVPGSPDVYFQEGNDCGAGHVTGTLTCSSVPGPALDEGNCPMNKSDKLYTDDSGDCP